MAASTETARIAKADVSFDDLAKLVEKYGELLTGTQRERVKWFLIYRNYPSVAQRLEVGSNIDMGAMAVRNSVAHAYNRMLKQRDAAKAEKQKPVQPKATDDEFVSGMWVPTKELEHGALFVLHGAFPVQGCIERHERSRDHRYPDVDVTPGFEYRCSMNAKPANDSRIFMHFHGAWWHNALDAINEGDAILRVLRRMLEVHKRHMDLRWQGRRIKRRSSK